MPIGDVGASYAPTTATIPEQEETPTVSSLPRPTGFITEHSDPVQQPSHGYQSTDDVSLDVPKDPSPALTMNTAQETASGSAGGDYLNGYVNPAEADIPVLQEPDASTHLDSHGSDLPPRADETVSTEQAAAAGTYGLDAQTESPTTEMTPTATEFPVHQLQSVPHSDPAMVNASEPPSNEVATSGPYDTSHVVMAPVVANNVNANPQGIQQTSSSFSPPPGRPSGPAQSRAPPASSSSSMPQLPFPGAGNTLGTGLPPPAPPSSSSKRQSLPPAPLQKESYRSTSSSKSPPSASAPTSPNPGSPTRTKPTKQSSSSREPRQSVTKRSDSAEYAQRSSIAYLNDTPHIEPPMKAPPPVTSLGPLPSTSPYFNSYATLRSSSYGKNETTPSFGASGADTSSRPRGARSNSNSLGNKLGYDKRSSHSNQEKSLLQMPTANAYPGAASNKDYSYAIYNDIGSGGRKLNAGAFRRSQPHRESSYTSAQGSGADGTVSPAQRLRDEWRSSQIVPAPVETPSTYGTPSGTPGIAEPSLQELALAEQGQQPNRDSMDMYGDRAQSAYLHRTSAIDAPTDVLPSDNYSHTSLNRLAEDRGEEAVLPLNVRKRSVVSEMPDAPVHSSTEQVQSTKTGAGGFDGGRYVTNLE